MKALLITAIVVILILSVIFIPIRLYIRLCYNNDGFDAGYSLYFGFIPLKKSGKKTKDEQTDTEPEKKTEKKRKLKKKSVLQIIRFIRSNSTQIKNLVYDLLGYMFRRGMKFEKIDIKSIGLSLQMIIPERHLLKLPMMM